jgi:ATP/maltotriose-dependent transcriptional regulator MalT
MSFTSALDRGRDAFTHHAWREAYTQLSAADRDAALEPETIEQLALAAYLLGRDLESCDLLSRAHAAYLARRAMTQAARCAFRLGMALLTRGEHASASGWIARANRLLDDEGQHDCVERGYLLLPEARYCLARGDVSAGEAKFAEAVRIGERFGDVDLVTLARQGRGRALIRLGEIARGVALLDEVMVAVTAGELTPLSAGIVYCSVISACFEIFDVRRAGEWTAALTRWCAAQPDLVAYRGQCLIHRAEILALQGIWPDALDEAQRACERLSQPPPQPEIGAALYQLGELYRLRGDFARAEELYREASQSGRTPQPGLARLRLAQGRIDAAKAAICRLVDEGSPDRRGRALVLAAAVEILLAAKEVSAARRAADELSSIATTIDTPLPRAMSAHATGAVLLAEEDARAAVTVLRTAWTIWRELDAPYESARAAVLIGLACRALGDEDSAQLELDAAARIFRRLGAATELAQLDAFAEVSAAEATGSPDAPAPAEVLDGTPGGALTARELQVLRLVATGKTNRVIADALAISEKTVARHISNIFTKLDLSSRAAATAYAFQHGLV